MSLSQFILVTILGVFWIGEVSEAADFKARAREHYEIHTITTENDSQVFRGFSNTINLWWEEPFDISYGFAISPLLAGLSSDSEDPFGDRIMYYNIGFEAKYFPKVGFEQIYVRPGLAFAHIKPGQGNDLSGFSVYAGIGYEFKISSLGLALEIGNRIAFLADSTMVTSLIPSLGLHFYEIF